MVSRRRHWDSIYRTKGEDELSWHQDEPTASLRLLRGVANRRSRIVDIGGGTSPLAGRLSAHGFHQVTVVDIADAAVQLGPKRSGTGEPNVRWIRADVTRVDRLARFDVWHDRAFFHFLTDAKDRRAYVRLARRSVPVGGHVILATFALDGPETCSGLDVVRYDGSKLEWEFARGFRLLRERREIHRTPWGARQPFTYVVFRRVRTAEAGARARSRSPRARPRSQSPRP